MSLLQRIRDTGRYPPSLLADERNVGDSTFDALIARVLDMTPNSISVSSDPQVAGTVAGDFASILKMCESADNIPGDLDSTKKTLALEQRRCIVLAIIGSTPPENESLALILNNGLLTSLLPWIDDILSNKVGSIDLLLLFLTSIADLPVTRTHVRDSGMGKKVGSIEKHKICVGTPNENNIKVRVKAVKDAWNTSVKSRKDSAASGNDKKRESSSEENGSAAKKAKTSFSGLMMKVEGQSPSKSKIISKAPIAGGSLAVPPLSGTSSSTPTKSPAKAKKSNLRVKWSDHFGGELQHTREIEGNNGEQPAPVDPSAAGGTSGSWSDRKKRDRLREKELLAAARKKKLIDDDDDDDVFAGPAMRATIAWRSPRVTPDITPTKVESKELVVQLGRMASVAPVRYTSDRSVPANPNALSDVESALDMQAAQSATPTVIPFFVPQEPVPPAPAPAPLPTPQAPPPVAVAPPQPYVNAYAPPNAGATIETVQAMGLPLFLVGSNVQALQTLASNPSWLGTFVDKFGNYDQQSLLQLVQTLGQSMAPAQPAAPPPPPQPNVYGNHYGQPMPVQTYAAPAPVPMNPYGPAGGMANPPAPSGHYGPGAGAPRTAVTGEANLHVAGYGPTTTQAEIIAVFSPYVHVREVVMKSGFSFVNTSDAAGAANAKQALAGALVGGMPIRINMAQRRSGGAPPPPHAVSGHGAYGPPPTAVAAPLPVSASGVVDVSSVRDDRGNPATKNLFVAGYGGGTSEQQIRDLFNAHALITGCVMKGNFSFVNTNDRSAAVRAREALMGTVVNGGPLRINFAKETGRLGTSFDLTYNQNTGPNSSRSYYGR